MKLTASLLIAGACVIFFAGPVKHAYNAVVESNEMNKQLIIDIEKAMDESEPAGISVNVDTPKGNVKVDVPKFGEWEPPALPKATPAHKAATERQEDPEIVQHWSETCVYCQVDEKTVFPLWRKAGWSIRKAAKPETTGKVPWYDVFEANGNYFRIQGRLTKESFEKAKAGK